MYTFMCACMIIIYPEKIKYGFDQYRPIARSYVANFHFNELYIYMYMFVHGCMCACIC